MKKLHEYLSGKISRLIEYVKKDWRYFSDDLTYEERVIEEKKRTSKTQNILMFSFSSDDYSELKKDFQKHPHL